MEHSIRWVRAVIFLFFVLPHTQTYATANDEVEAAIQPYRQCLQARGAQKMRAGFSHYYESMPILWKNASDDRVREFILQSLPYFLFNDDCFQGVFFFVLAQKTYDERVKQYAYATVNQFLKASNTFIEARVPAYQKDYSAEKRLRTFLSDILFSLPPAHLSNRAYPDLMEVASDFVIGLLRSTGQYGLAVEAQMEDWAGRGSYYSQYEQLARTYLTKTRGRQETQLLVEQVRRRALPDLVVSDLRYLKSLTQEVRQSANVNAAHLQADIRSIFDVQFRLIRLKEEADKKGVTIPEEVADEFRKEILEAMELKPTELWRELFLRVNALSPPPAFRTAIDTACQADDNDLFMPTPVGGQDSLSVYEEAKKRFAENRKMLLSKACRMNLLLAAGIIIFERSEILLAQSGSHRLYSQIPFKAFSVYNVSVPFSYDNRSELREEEIVILEHNRERLSESLERLDRIQSLGELNHYLDTLLSELGEPSRNLIPKANLVLNIPQNLQQEIIKQLDEAGRYDQRPKVSKWIDEIKQFLLRTGEINLLAPPESVEHLLLIGLLPPSTRSYVIRFIRSMAVGKNNLRAPSVEERSKFLRFPNLAVFVPNDQLGSSLSNRTSNRTSDEGTILMKLEHSIGSLASAFVHEAYHAIDVARQEFWPQLDCVGAKLRALEERNIQLMKEELASITDIEESKRRKMQYLLFMGLGLTPGPLCKEINVLKQEHKRLSDQSNYVMERGAYNAQWVYGEQLIQLSKSYGEFLASFGGLAGQSYPDQGINPLILDDDLMSRYEIEPSHITQAEKKHAAIFKLTKGN
ncbi:MAG: hypothetical protein HY537_12600 [Deltaproteobacteria bacterium]|nr:hypothetical protein [Deltaproteobacteria bacterium]